MSLEERVQALERSRSRLVASLVVSWVVGALLAFVTLVVGIFALTAYNWSVPDFGAWGHEAILYRLDRLEVGEAEADRKRVIRQQIRAGTSASDLIELQRTLKR